MNPHDETHTSIPPAAEPTRTQPPPPDKDASDAAWDAGLAAAFGVAETRSYTPPADPEPGTVIAGRYQLSQRIGEGGMGSVWVAHQSEPVKRKVAVKLIKAGMDSKSVLARFEAERQALAVMDHPNIAKVLDGGLHDGRPFFVMELVKGVPITDYCDARKLTPRQRLELFVPVCQAIQHAHQKGIIHRDIKPSNVLIALYDDKPVPKVIDFGVAKATGGTLTEHTIETAFGGVVGTPQYMSPEQASLNNLDIDTRSDVYALGVLLYELLTGSPPFSSDELKKKGLLEILRVVREEEPPRPSTKLSTANALPTLSANRGTEPKKLTRLLRNELDWIVMKAMEKDRTRRYETANGFAADIQRYLAGEAVHAHPPSTTYRLWKFLRKNRQSLTVAALLLVALLAGVASTTWQAAERRRDHDVAAARSRQAVESALDQAEVALRAEKLADVDAALAIAEQGIEQADHLDLRNRIAAVKKDRAMVTRLNGIFEQAWSISIGSSDVIDGDNRTRNARRYKEAFAEYGFRLGVGEGGPMLDHLRRSPIRQSLLTALGNWFFFDPKQAGLQVLLDSADLDTFRSVVRAAVSAGDQEQLEKLTERADGAMLPPGFALTLALHGAHKERLRIMKAAWRVNPDYYPLAHQIGYYQYLNMEFSESAHWFRLALALRPNSLSARMNLFHSIGCNHGFLRVGDEIDQQSREECEAILRDIIRLGQSDVEIHAWLGMVLFFHKGDINSAQLAFEKALSLDPSSRAARLGLLSMIEKRKDWQALAKCLEELNWSQKAQCSSYWILDNIDSILYIFLHRDMILSLLKAGRPGLALRYSTKTYPDELAAQQPADPKSQPNSDRYYAACAAVLAGSGQGSDAPPLPEWPGVRRKALGWLSADLRQWDRCMAADPASNRQAAHQAMNQWLADKYLKHVRGEAELAKLPADEQAEWRKLWAEVRSLRDRTTPPPQAPMPREKK